jgi:hypothetical protein
MIGEYDFIVLIGPVFMIGSLIYAKRDDSIKNKIIKLFIGLSIYTVAIFNLSHIYYDADKWHHVAVTFNRQFNKLYVDGELSEEWDSSSWRCNVVSFILAVDKYSPNINTSKIKAQINLVYDQYNGGNSFNNNGVNVRPFPMVNTPIYKEKYSNKVAKYEVVEGDVILSQFVELDRAKEYAEAYVKYNLKIDLIRKLIGNENYSYLEAYDTSYNHKKWVYVRMIK